MSHAGLILGLPELEVERVDRNDAISVYAKPKKTLGSSSLTGDTGAH